MVITADIDEVAGGYVTELLSTKGFTVIGREGENPDPTAIDAIGPTKLMLIRVGTSVGPVYPDGLSLGEVRALRARAKEEAAEAWEALVTLTPDFALAGSLRWRRLL
jgi:hypothetical protein